MKKSPNFEKECRAMISLIGKLERMTVSLPFLKSLQCINHSNISDKEKKSLKQIQRLVQILTGHSIISDTITHKSFQDLISNGEEIAKCSKFDRKAERLDSFVFKKLDMDKKYQNLAIIFQLIFILSHVRVRIRG